MRQIQITIPNEKLHQVLDSLLGLNVKGIHVISGETDSLMIFRIQVSRTADIIEGLNSIGVGVVTGIIDVLEVKATIPPLEVLTAKHESKIEAKIPVEEIYRELVSNSELTYRFAIFSILSAFLAGIGLIYNNSVIIIAAMVLAPLLGPILALSYSIVVKDKNLIKLSLRTELIGFLIALSSGVFLGIIFNFIVPMLKPYIFLPSFPSLLYDYLPYNLWLPHEILIRGELNSFSINIVIAFIMGVAVGFSLTEGIAGSAVGIAIGASILPPIVNAGICFVIGAADLGIVSSFLFIINFVVITLVSIIIFQLKKMRAPIKTYFLWRGPRLPKEKVEEEPPSVISRIFGRFRKKQPVVKTKGKKTVEKKTKAVKVIEKEAPQIKADIIKSEIKEVVKEAIKEEMKKDEKKEIEKKKSEGLEKEVKKEIQKEIKKAVKQAIKEEVKKTPEKENKKESTALKKEEIREVVKEAFKEGIKEEAPQKNNDKEKLKKHEIKQVIKEVIKEEIKNHEKEKEKT
ncbi:MAG: TIGR00341 family protein [Candidatus Helarchaeota archaeon]